MKTRISHWSPLLLPGGDVEKGLREHTCILFESESADRHRAEDKESSMSRDRQEETA